VVHDKLWGLWKHYLIVGGLPAVINEYREVEDNRYYDIFQRVRKIQRNLIDTYNADIAKHSGKTNALHIERVWKNVPAQLSRNNDNSAPRFRFKDAIPGLRGYEQLAGPIEWLESANLLLRCSSVESPDIPLSAWVSNNMFKLYMSDTGLLGALSDIGPKVFLDYNFGSYKGYVAENFVAQELKAAFQTELYFWQGRTSEIEFLFQHNSQIIPIEVKAGNRTRSKSLSFYENKFKPDKSIILSARSGGHDESRLYLPLYFAGKLAWEFSG